MRNNIPSTLGIGVTTTWNGTSWNNGAPNVNTIARIAGTYTTATHGSISCLDLYLDSGTVTISSNTYIRVNRNITQAASGVTFNVSSNGALALYDPNVDTTSVKLTITRTLPYNLVRLDYRGLGDPISGKKILTLSPTTLANRFYAYDSVTNAFVTTTSYNVITAGADVANSIFKPGCGFLIRTPNTFPTTPSSWTVSTSNVSVSGKLNAGVIKVPYQVNPNPNPNSFAMVSNPYSAPIDMGKFLAANPIFIGYANQYLKTNAAVGNSYTYRNRWSSTASIGETSTIDIFDGFFLTIPPGSPEGEIVFTPDMMVINRNYDMVNGFSIAASVPSVGLPIAIVGYTELNYSGDFATASFTLSSGFPMLIKIGSDPLRYASYGDTTQRSSIDLDVYGSTSTTMTISLFTSYGRFTNIILQDLALGTSQDLSTGSYTFSSTLGSIYTDRFKITMT